MQRIPHLVINNLSNPKQKKFKLQSYLATAPYFFNFSEFQAWKDSLEGRKDCLFIKNTGGKRCGESNVEYTSIATVKEITSLTEKEKGVYCLKTTPVKENVIA